MDGGGREGVTKRKEEPPEAAEGITPAYSPRGSLIQQHVTNRRRGTTRSWADVRGQTGRRPWNRTKLATGATGQGPPSLLTVPSSAAD